MYNNKLLFLLDNFTNIEFNQIRKYLDSPYFNSNKNLLIIFDYLRKQIKKKNHAWLPEKEKVWKLIYPDKNYNDVRYRKLFSELLKLVEGFLSQQEYEENSVIAASLLIRSIGKRKLTKLYNVSLKRAYDLLEKKPERSGNYYLEKYIIEKNYYELQDSDLARDSESNIENIINNLDYFYLSEKMRLYNGILIRMKHIEHDYHLLFVNEILSHLEKEKYEDIPSIGIYYKEYLINSDAESTVHFNDLKKMLKEKSDLFPKEEAINLYTSALNYCIRKANKGNRQFLQEMIDLNVEMLEKNIIEDGELSPWKFKNIVLSSLRLGNYDWVEKFIEENISKIPDKHQENAYSFNLASLRFYQKDYGKVMELLREVEYTDFAYNLNSKNILLCTYYELDEIEPLYSLMKSFRVFLKRQSKLPQNRTTHYINLIKFTKKLTKLFPSEKTKVLKLKKEAEECEMLSSRKWLMEKIDEKLGKG